MSHRKLARENKRGQKDRGSGFRMEDQQGIHLKEQELKSWAGVAIVILNWNEWRNTIECLEERKC